MICDCCRREVDYFRGSFWHGDARICRECFAQWSDLDNDSIDCGDHRNIGNYVRLKHGLPPLAAALAILLLSQASAAYASPHCLDQSEATRTWPTRALVKDDDGCWTYDHHPPREEAPIWVPATIMPAPEPTLMDRWPEKNLLEVELSELEPEPPTQAPPLVTMRHLALFLSLVLATAAVVGVATGQAEGNARRRWPARRSTHVRRRSRNASRVQSRPLRASAEKWRSRQDSNLRPTV